MKTKIASLCLAAVFSILALVTNSSAAEEGFYDKEHIRGFISIGADYRGMRSEFQKYVNNIAFQNIGHMSKAVITDTSGKADTVLAKYYGNYKYSKFDNFYLGLHFIVGAQYKQFLTWVDINFMPYQKSERTAKNYVTTVESRYSEANPQNLAYGLYDVEWFSYGADWMFGWKILGEKSTFNVIPSVGIGFNMINFHLASGFTISNEDRSKYEHVRDRFYSTMAATFTAELELRLEFDQFAVGAYGGIRFVRYSELEIEGFNVDPNPNGTDNVGDTWYGGLRFTWMFLSPWEKKQQDKI